MTENKRFYMDKSGDLYDRENKTVMIDFGYSYDGVGCKRIIDLLNELHEENQFLKEKEKDMLDYLKKEYDFIYNQKRKHFDDAILVTSYELIEYHIRSMIEHLERL